MFAAGDLDVIPDQPLGFAGPDAVDDDVVLGLSVEAKRPRTRQLEIGIHQVEDSARPGLKPDAGIEEVDPRPSAVDAPERRAGPFRAEAVEQNVGSVVQDMNIRALEIDLTAIHLLPVKLKWDDPVVDPDKP